jgi:hypothetical protein
MEYGDEHGPSCAAVSGVSAGGGTRRMRACRRNRSIIRPGAGAAAIRRTADRSDRQRQDASSGARQRPRFREWRGAGDHLKSNARYTENVFKAQPTMDVCTKLMNDVVKRVRSSENKGPASYYCVPVQNGKFGSPMLVAQYES